MDKASREFQVFVKPIGSICNLDCHYCYYLEKERLYPEGEKFQMRYEVLEEYIIQHIDASPEAV
ncbi:MAG: anaerobic sulfatase maturase, partial [Candidatus Bathyarchaeia archaeon]